jgi:signal transduction histidine kinase
MFLSKGAKLKKSLFFQLTLMHALAFSVLSAISFSVFYYWIYSATMEREDKELLGDAARYKGMLRTGGVERVRAAITDPPDPQDPGEEFIRLFTFTGKIIAETDMSRWGAIPKDEVIARLRNSNTDQDLRIIPIPGEDAKARLVSAVIGPDAILQKGDSLAEIDEHLAIFRNLFAVLTVALIAVSTLIGWFLARRALGGMQSVTQTAEEISNGAYDRRVVVKDQFHEIETLGATFNRMLDRIQSLLKSMTEINDNIAHDLRSPLARIRGIAEMALLDQKSLEDFKDMAANTVEECDHLIGIINTMLDITEVEAGVARAEVERIDLAELIAGACDLFAPLAEARKIKLQADLPESLIVESDRKKIQRIVTNILENALKYTPAQGTVTISAAALDHTIEMRFSDTGIGISADDLPHIFERFYRSDRSRPHGGVGLGLSLVKAYTQSLHGTIHVESLAGQGSTFTLRLLR